MNKERLRLYEFAPVTEETVNLFQDRTVKKIAKMFLYYLLCSSKYVTFVVSKSSLRYENIRTEKGAKCKRLLLCQSWRETRPMVFTYNR